MRPGLAIVGLFAVLLLTYALFQGSIGTLGKFLLQASLVLDILAGAIWFRYNGGRKGWFFFGDDENEEGEDQSGGDGHGDGDGEDPKADEIRKAS